MSASTISRGIELTTLPACSPTKPSDHLMDVAHRVTKATVQEFQALLIQGSNIKEGDDLTNFVVRLERFQKLAGGENEEINNAYEMAVGQLLTKRPATTKTETSDLIDYDRASGGYRVSPHGFRNFGATCFANAALQFVFNTPGIDEVLSRGIAKRDESKDRIKFREDFRALRAEYKKEQPDKEKVGRLLTLLWASPALSRFSMPLVQGDANDFLETIYGILNVREHPHFTLAASSKRMNPETGETVFAQGYRERMQLPIPSGSPTLQECVDEYLKTETLEGLIPDRPECKNKCLFLKGEAPETIQFSLRRFEWKAEEMCSQKINTSIKGFDQDLSIPFCNDQGVETSKAAYQVDAVICHDGDTGGGHYFTLIRTPDGGWKQLNDNIERLLSNKEGLAIIEKNGYLVKAHKV